MQVYFKFLIYFMGTFLENAQSRIDSNTRILSKEMDLDVESGYYSDEKVGEYLSALKAGVDGFSEEELLLLPSASMRESTVRLHEYEKEALAYCEKLGVQDMAKEARRLEALLFSLEKSALSKGDRVVAFLEGCGGEKHFQLVFRGLQCAGPLHDISMALTTLKMDVSTVMSGLKEQPEAIEEMRRKFKMLLTDVTS